MIEKNKREQEEKDARPQRPPFWRVLESVEIRTASRDLVTRGCARSTECRWLFQDTLRDRPNRTGVPAERTLLRTKTTQRKRLAKDTNLQVRADLEKLENAVKGRRTNMHKRPAWLDSVYR